MYKRQTLYLLGLIFEQTGRSKLRTEEIIDAANHCTIQRLLARYFSTRPRYGTREIVGATFVIEPSRHRTGLPPEAAPRRYIITHVAEGWSVIVRTVWRDGRLLQPVATHTRIDLYLDDDGRHNDDESVVAVAVSAWLRSLNL